MKNNTVQKNIPQGWQENKLLDCLRVPSKLAGIKLSEYEKEGDFPVFDQGQDYISGFSSNKDLVVKDVPAILFGDHTRIVKYIKSPFVAGADGTKIFWAKEAFDSTFLYYLVLSQKIPNTGYNRHFKFFKDIKVLTPESKKEQRKIAEILGTADEDIAKTQEVIEATEKLKRGLMQQLFTRGIGQIKFKKVKLGDICDITKLAGFEYSKYFNSYKDAGEIIVVRGSNIKDGQIDLSSIKTIPLQTSNLLPRSQLKKGDLVFAYVGTIGPVALITEDKKYHLGPNTARVTPIKDVTANYLYWYFRSPLVEVEINKRISVTAQPSLSMEKIRGFELTIPESKDDQEEISKILSAINEKILVNKKLKAKFTLLKQGLMQDLLSGKVRTNI